VPGQQDVGFSHIGIQDGQPVMVRKLFFRGKINVDVSFLPWGPRPAFAILLRWARPGLFTARD